MKNINFYEGQRKIAYMWFGFSAILFLLIFLQYILGKFENKNQEAWGWFFGLILPNLTLMLTVFVTDTNNKDDTSEIRMFYYRLTAGLSIFYFMSISLIILLQPMIQKPIIQLMSESNLFLVPIQGVVSGSIGLFFVKKEK